MSDRAKWLEELREMDLEELRGVYARLCTIERGHEIYGINADRYESQGADLSADLDEVEAEYRRRGLEPPTD